MKAKLLENKIGDKILITIAILVGISILSGFVSKDSLLGMIGIPIFKYLTMPILAVGVLPILWKTVLAFFDKEYFKKDFNFIVFVGHILWLGWVVFLGGILWLSVIKTYIQFFTGV
jgi:hypothetical protein